MTVSRAMAPDGNADALAATLTATTTSTSTPSSSSSLTCVSWDIDGTILRAKGDVANKLHHRAFSHAWKEIFGLDFHIRDIPHQGSTDPLILLSGVREAVARRTGKGSRGGEGAAGEGREGYDGDGASFTHEQAFALLKEAERAMTSFYEAAATDAAVAAEGLELLPGVEALLEDLAAREGVVQGLVTGNLQPIGWRKVETLGVAHHFDEVLSSEGEEEDGGGGGGGGAGGERRRERAVRRVGGFGSDFCSAEESAIDEPWRDRAKFIEVAAERALRTRAAAAVAAKAPSCPPPLRKVHIGDTPFDLKAAAEAGALPVGVATGIFSKEELVAAGVPGAVILDDLSDLEASLKAMGF
jgi:phosphoglycolate phosphatase